MEKAEGEINQCIEKTKIPLEELKKLIGLAKKSRQEGKKREKKIGISKKDLLEYGRVVKSAQKKIKRIEVESTLDAKVLKKAIKSIEEGELKTKLAKDEVWTRRKSRSYSGASGTGLQLNQRKDQTNRRKSSSKAETSQ